jgi:hypothetical protein
MSLKWPEMYKMLSASAHMLSPSLVYERKMNFCCRWMGRVMMGGYNKGFSKLSRSASKTKGGRKTTTKKTEQGEKTGSA